MNVYLVTFSDNTVLSLNAMSWADASWQAYGHAFRVWGDRTLTVVSVVKGQELA